MGRLSLGSGDFHLFGLSLRSFYSIFATLGSNLLRAVFEVFVTLESAHKHVDNVVFDTGIGVCVDVDIAFAQKFNHRSDRNVEVFRYFTYFRFRH